MLLFISAMIFLVTISTIIIVIVVIMIILQMYKSSPGKAGGGNLQIAESVQKENHSGSQLSLLLWSDSENVQVHIRTSPNASPEKVGVFVGSDPTNSVTAPCKFENEIGN